MSKSREKIKIIGAMAEVENIHKHKWKKAKKDSVLQDCLIEYCTKCNWIRGWKNEVGK